MAPECQLVVVVGSRNSSNSVRLVEVALGAGLDVGPSGGLCRTTSTGLAVRVTTVGVTSGASVPEILVRGVLERLPIRLRRRAAGTTANETLVFALPREIRPART